MLGNLQFKKYTWDHGRVTPIYGWCLLQVPCQAAYFDNVGLSGRRGFHGPNGQWDQRRGGFPGGGGGGRGMALHTQRLFHRRAAGMSAASGRPGRGWRAAALLALGAAAKPRPAWPCLPPHSGVPPPPCQGSGCPPLAEWLVAIPPYEPPLLTHRRGFVTGVLLFFFVGDKGALQIVGPPVPYVPPPCCTPSPFFGFPGGGGPLGRWCLDSALAHIFDICI